MTTVNNAKVENVFFGVPYDYSDSVCWSLTFEFGNGLSQGTGFISFHGTGMIQIEKLCGIFEVDDFYKIKGKYCRIKHDKTMTEGSNLPALDAKIVSIGSILQEEWCDLYV